MRALAFLLFAPCIAAPATAQNKTSLRRLDGTTISAQQAETIASAELTADHIAGAQIAIIERGHVAWTYAFGLRDTAKHLPMTTETDLWAASITKGVFATWVMRLVERHRLDLDQPIARMLTRPLNEYEMYRNEASDLIKDPAWQRVTPRMLLTHTSGLANYAPADDQDKLRLHFTPGTRFAYSGDGLNILQLAIEEKLGEPLDRAMDHDLFQPLGMTRTGLVWKPAFDENAALRYDAHGGMISATHRLQPRAAGSMETTLHDLCLFFTALLANRIISPSARAEMLRPQFTIHTAHQFPTFATAKGNDGEAEGLAYGLGWGLLPRTKYGPAFFKEGHGDGAENYVICFTRSEICMMLLTNSDNGELAFRPLLEKILGDTVTPWEWESYTREAVLHNEEHAR